MEAVNKNKSTHLQETETDRIAVGAQQSAVMIRKRMGLSRLSRRLQCGETFKYGARMRGLSTG